MRRSAGPDDDALFDPADIAQQILVAQSTALPGQATGEQSRHAADPATEHGLIPDSLSDRGNAKLFVSVYGRDFRHVPGLGWYRWCGYRWEIDDDDTVLWAAGELAESLAEVATTGRHTTTALRRHRQKALSTPGIKAMLTQAKAAPGMILNAAVLDADPYALCTPAGVVDLRTGTLAPPDPERHYHARSTTVPPRPMPIPRWRRFLTDSFGEDAEGAEMISFLHELLGYSITGDVGAQIMPFLYGVGKNGKSVLLDVMVKLLGDYADAAPPGFLMARPYEGHPTDLAELHGRRIIVCSELKPGDRFDEARVKLLTGGDRIMARRMRQDFFSFRPTHKLWLLGNHRPEVGLGGYAFWRRMKLIPFDHIVTDERKVDNLADVLVTEEGPGILHWLIDGARCYLGGPRDLTGPERVRTATSAYAETEDHTGRFIGECCALGPARRAEQARLYAAYEDWCRLEGATPLSSRAFATRIRETVGIASSQEMIRSNQRRFYPGIALTAEVGADG